MNKSPFNFLITIALCAILWVITAIFYGGTYSESLMLASLTPEDFLAFLRTMLVIAAGVGLINCLCWYYYGGLTSTSGNLGKAKRIWRASFIIQIIASIGIVVVLILKYKDEGLSTKDWLIIFGLMSLHTWFFFWFCTFLMSPRTVKFIPLFK